MKRIQIRFEEDLLTAIDNYAASSQKTRAAIIREAVKSLIRQKQVKEFEDEWIKKLKERPQDDEETETWMKVQHWSGEGTVAI